MATSPEHGPNQAGHTRPAIEWNVDKLIQWIEEKQKGQLDEDERAKLRKERVTGRVFLSCNGNEDFFRGGCGLSLGTAVVLAELSRELAVKEGNMQRAEDAERPNATSLSYDDSERVAKIVEATIAGMKRGIQQAGDADMSNTASKKPRLEGGPDGQQLAKRARQQRELILQKIEKLKQPPVLPPSEHVAPRPDIVERFSDPNFDTELPFPFIGDRVPVRFKTSHDDERKWSYMGRMKFSSLVDEFRGICSGPAYMALIVYGTRGYGKSHLLATLVCLLVAEGENVVYIPDCRALIDQPVEYMRQAMLFAWANDKNIQQTILALNSEDGICEFFKRQSEVSKPVFVIDQLNALEKDENDDASTNKRRSRLNQLLLGLVSGAKGVLSTSANNHKILGTSTKQNNYRTMYTYGGLAKEEMKCWWTRKEKIKLADGKKFKVEDNMKYKVEDFTGRIPLFLDQCIVDGKIDLNSSFFKMISKQATRFESEIQKKCNNDKNDLLSHYNYMKACIYGQAVDELSHDISKLVDHRYFYEEYDQARKNYMGQYSCGLARNAVAPLLLANRLDYKDRDFLQALPDFIDNPSVAGFMMEQAILASIALNGLDNIYGSPKKLEPRLFGGDYPSFDTSAEHPILYIPKAFNFRFIDGIIIVIKKMRGAWTEKNKPTLFMYPLQITLGLDKHSDSRTQFFSEWKEWNKGLKDFNVVPHFLWISPKEKNSKPYKETKECPTYTEYYISIRSINRSIWESYMELKEKRGWESENTEIKGSRNKKSQGNKKSMEIRRVGEQEELEAEESGCHGLGRSVRAKAMAMADKLPPLSRLRPRPTRGRY